MIYYIVFAWTIIFSFGINKKKKPISVKKYKISIHESNIKNVMYVMLSATPLMLITAFRYGIGTDYFYTYIPQFNIIAETGENIYYEIGFYYLNRLIALFTHNAHSIIFITSLLFISFIYFALLNLAENIPLSLFCFFASYTYYIALNNVRQSLASAILLISLFYFFNGNKKGFILGVIIATLIHRVSIVFFVFLFIEIKNIYATTYLVIALISYIIGENIAPVLLKLLVRYIPRLGLYLSVSELQIYRSNTMSRLMILIYFVWMIIMCVLEKREFRLEKKTLRYQREWRVVKMMQCLSLCVAAFDGIIPATYRIVRVFTFSQFLLLPNMLSYKRIGKKELVVLKVMMYVTFLLMYIKLYGTEGVMPYQSIFRK